MVLAPVRVLGGRCPTDPRRVAVTESGLSLRARFSALLFLIQDQYSNMYLHCSLSLCNQRASSCVPVSHKRSIKRLLATLAGFNRWS